MLNLQYDQEAEHRAIRQEERAKAEAEKIEIAKSLLKSGVSVEIIANSSGLSIEVIESLRDKRD